MESPRLGRRSDVRTRPTLLSTTRLCGHSILGTRPTFLGTRLHEMSQNIKNQYKDTMKLQYSNLPGDTHRIVDKTCSSLASTSLASASQRLGETGQRSPEEPENKRNTQVKATKKNKRKFLIFNTYRAHMGWHSTNNVLLCLRGNIDRFLNRPGLANISDFQIWNK